MKIILWDDHLRINLSILEKIGAAKSSFYIPYDDIVSVFSESSHKLMGIKVAGTNIPKILEMGTYLSGTQKQFWYVKKRKYDYLVIVLKSNFYSKIILELKDSVDLANKINKLLEKK